MSFGELGTLSKDDDDGSENVDSFSVLIVKDVTVQLC